MAEISKKDSLKTNITLKNWGTLIIGAIKNDSYETFSYEHLFLVNLL